MTERPIRVGFLTTDNPLGHSGIDRYTSDLLQELAKRDDLTVVPVTSATSAAWLREHVRGVDEVITTRAPHGIARSVEERFGLGRRLARARVDVVHGTKHILPWRSPCPSVLTIYDLFAFTRGHDYRTSKRLLLPIVYRQSIARADRVIAMTASIRQQLTALGLVEATRVDVVPAAPSTALTSATAEPIAALVDRPFAACVGDLSPRKNVDVLLRIWPAVHRDAGLVLALVGPNRSRSETTRTRVAELERSGAVVRVGEVSDGGLRWCYENAKVVLMPSFEEGYGLPAIEAGYFGADLATSNDPALVEVTGAAAAHLDARDDAGWERTVLAIAAGRPEPRAAPAIGSWTDIAALTADVYRKAAIATR